MDSESRLSQIIELITGIEVDPDISDTEKWECFMDIKGWVTDAAQTLEVDDETRMSGL
jgi:hypothetical protein